MTAVIKLSATKSYNYPLSYQDKQPSLALRIYNAIIDFFRKLEALFKPISDIITKGCDQFEGMLMTLPLRPFVKINKSSFCYINHSYQKASKEQKKALTTYIYDELEQKLPLLTDDQKTILATKIATDNKIFNLQGLCLGYAWLFATYVLTHQEALDNPKTLLKRFIEDKTFKIAPIISFAAHVNFSSLVQAQENGGVTITSQALRNDGIDENKNQQAIAALKKYACPSFKLEDRFTYMTALKNKLAIFDQLIETTKALELEEKNSTMTTTPTQDRYTQLRAEEKAQDPFINDYSSIMNAASFEQQIMLTNSQPSFKDKKSYTISILPDNHGKGHVMSIYTDHQTNTFLFFDPNLGIISFPSLKDLAKGVAIYSKLNYGALKANSIGPVSLN